MNLDCQRAGFRIVGVEELEYQPSSVEVSESPGKKSARHVAERFGIETGYRQGNQARIRTSEHTPKLRLLYVALALILRNVWVWLHFTIFAESRGEHPELRRERLRFRRMLEWIEEVAKKELRDGTLPATQWQPGP